MSRWHTSKKRVGWIYAKQQQLNTQTQTRSKWERRERVGRWLQWWQEKKQIRLKAILEEREKTKERQKETLQGSRKRCEAKRLSSDVAGSACLSLGDAAAACWLRFQLTGRRSTVSERHSSLLRLLPPIQTVADGKNSAPRSGGGSADPPERKHRV